MLTFFIVSSSGVAWSSPTALLEFLAICHVHNPEGSILPSNCFYANLMASSISVSFSSNEQWWNNNLFNPWINACQDGLRDPGLKSFVWFISQDHYIGIDQPWRHPIITFPFTHGMDSQPLPHSLWQGLKTLLSVDVQTRWPATKAKVTVIPNNRHCWPSCVFKQI